MVVAGTDAAATVLPHLARQLIALHSLRADVAAQVETLVQAHPLYQVLTSMPGIGVRPSAVFLAETLGKTFDTGAQLASYAGLAPVTRRSGSSIRGEHVSHGGNKRLKRAMFLSAFASLRSDPVSRAYYQRKRDQGKRHNQAVLALAHRRLTHHIGAPPRESATAFRSENVLLLQTTEVRSQSSGGERSPRAESTFSTTWPPVRTAGAGALRFSPRRGRTASQTAPRPAPRGPQGWRARSAAPMSPAS